jgi:hypothetical protein
MDWASWSPQMRQTYGSAALRRYHVDTGKLDNCEICHR